MAGILNTAVSGLRAYQTALTTVSQNISNVGTEGYSRQKVELDARLPQTFGNINIGQGVVATEINRVFDVFINANIREFQSSFSRLDMFGSFASRTENLIADEQGSLMPALNDFFNAVNDVANDPSSNAPRVALLGAAENLQQRMVSLSTEMQKLEQEVDQRITFQVGEINAITTQIAQLNGSIASNSTVDNRPADLLDKRDLLLKQLAEKITTSVVEQADGTLNVLAGTGQLLVTGSVSINLTTQADFFQPDRLAIAIQGDSGNVDITRTLSGGELGGLLDFRNNLLDSAQNRLGRSAIALAQAFNNQHVQGYDLNGSTGNNFFSTGAPQILDNLSNSGTAVVAVSISNAQALTVSDYEVRFSAGNYDIVRLNDNVSVSSGAYVDPSNVSIDGLDFNLTGAPVAGDSFYVRPTRLGALGFQALISDPNAVAAASPLRSQQSVNNIGTGEVSSPTIVDASNVNLTNSVTITFNNPAGTFDVFDVSAGALIAPAGRAYTPGMLLAENGWQIQLSGTPQPGDVFSVEENVGAASDNRNALLLAGIRSQGILDGGTATLEQAYSALTAEVGNITQQVIINKEVEGSLLNGANQQRESISGVNLDEEAGDLIRFQQAYQALARVIQTAQSIFQSLLDAT
jgi:flagellar hook-associated protein 1 FlgK